MTKPVEALLETEMSRQEFLLTLGFGAASLFGFSSIIHMLTGRSFGSHLSQKNGYGSSPYGGNKE